MSEFLATAKEWWAGRSDRERWMLTGLGALIVALVFWYGLLQPLRGLAAAAEARHDRAAAALAEARSLKAGIDAARPLAAPAAAAEAARATAREAGVVIAREEPQEDGSLSLWTRPVAARALFDWLAALQARGVGIRTVETHSAGGTTEARVVL